MSHSSQANEERPVLIAEDSPVQAKILQRLLEAEGYRVVAADNGQSALDLARLTLPALVISDVMMPGLSGYELCGQLKDCAELSEVPVILVTSLSDPNDIIAGLQAGADKFITKPYDATYLLGQVAQLLAERAPRGEGQALEVDYGGGRHTIHADSRQILDLLLSVYDAAIVKNRELTRAQADLRQLNEQLEQRVRERTAELQATTAEVQRLNAQLEQRVRERTAQLEEAVRELTAVANMTDGIVLTDGDWRITSANRSACRLLNLPPEDYQGRRLDEVLASFSLSVPAETLRASRDRATSVEVSRLETKPPLYLDGRLSRVLGPDREPASLILTLRDVTADKHNEFARANFFMMVSHKLRTPLSVLGGLLGFCCRLPGPKLADRGPELLAVCCKEIKALQELVDQLLEFKSVTAETPREVSAAADVATALDEAERRVREDFPDRPFEVVRRLPPDLGPAGVGPEHLALVLEKLIANGVKFADQPTRRIEVEAAREGADHLRLTVRDHGPGIPHEYFDRIFGGFVQVEDRTTGSVPGLGVGLYIVRRVVEAYGGSVTVDSRLGEGSAFSVVLPVPTEPRA